MGTETHKIRVLITGGGGFVGRALSCRLVALGYLVSSFSRNSYSELEQLGVKQFQGDLANKYQVQKALENQDIVFHVAARAGFWGSDQEFYKTNVQGTRNIVNGCKKLGIKKLIYTSSASVVFQGQSIENGSADLPYPRKGQNAYARTKAQGEKLVLQGNSDTLMTLALRPHIIWGPGDQHLVPRLLKNAKSGKLRIIGSGKNKVDTVYIDNLIDAHVLALEALDHQPACRGKAYFITNNEPVHLWELINRILEIHQMPVLKKKISYPIALTLARLSSSFYRIFLPKKEPLLQPYLVHELALSHWFDGSESHRDLGYSPRINMDQALQLFASSLP